MNGESEQGSLARRPQDYWTFKAWDLSSMNPPSKFEKPPLDSATRSIVVDYSSDAINARMRELAALWDFWRHLRKFKPATCCGQTDYTYAEQATAHETVP